MNHYQKLLSTNGYVKIKSSLPREKILKIKEKLCNQSHSQRVRQVSDLIGDPDIQLILNDKKLIEVLQAIYEKPVFYPNLQTQFNSFTQKSSYKRRFGLHIDGANELRLQSDGFSKQTPTWTNVGFYFQDAYNEGFGGGICGSTPLYKFIKLLFRLPYGLKFAEKVLQLAKKVLPDKFLPELKTDIGEFVIFDNRFPHASSVGNKIKDLLSTKQKTKQTFLSNMPKENNKLVLYVFSGEQSFAKNVMEFNFKASVKDYVEKGDFDYSKVMEFDTRSYNELYKIPFITKKNNEFR